MERFGLTRLDLMVMTWNQVAMLFEATYEENVKQDAADDSHWASGEEYAAWF